MTAATVSRSAVLAGLTTVTVTLPETFLLVRRLLGDESNYSPTYVIQVERVEKDTGGEIYFVKLLTERPKRSPSFVYVGVLNPRLGTIRLTQASAFPATATRYKVASRVLQAIFTNRVHQIEKAGWTVAVEVQREDGFAF